MKNLFVCFLLVFVFLACNKEDDFVDGRIQTPVCVAALYATTEIAAENGLLAVYRMDVDNEFHYWLNTGAMALDGPEYIIDADCDTVCSFNMLPPACFSDYKDRDWELVWEE